MLNKMKYLTKIAATVALLAAVGCKSSQNQTSTRVIQAGPAPTYTVELIPNPQLTPTSLEGDQRRVVYSSNIVAVYVNTNGMNASLTNAPESRAKGRGALTG